MIRICAIVMSAGAVSLAAADVPSLVSFDGAAGPGIWYDAESVVAVGGLDGQGPAGAAFSGGMLYGDTAGEAVRVRLEGFTEPGELTLSFTLATIDSWDGERAGKSYAPDFFETRVGGVTVFRESFTNFDGAQWAASYAPDRRTSRGAYFGNNGWLDSVYQIQLSGITHAGGPLEIEFLANGSGYESGGNEPFAVDNVRVGAVPSPAALSLGAALVLMSSRRTR